ncbi:MAG: hypothetical protein ACK5KT_14845 [Dysgonomonas sp.]
MKRVLRTITRTILFLFGVLLILWGGKGNLTNNGIIADSTGEKTTLEA